jgi:hypothetical protein
MYFLSNYVFNKFLEDDTMKYHDKLMAEIDRLRSDMHRLAYEGAEYSKLLAASQELDILIVKYYKFTMLGYFKYPALGYAGMQRAYQGAVEGGTECSNY